MSHPDEPTTDDTLTEPIPPPSTKWQVELKADGVVGQGTSPFPVEQNKDHS